MQTQIFVNHRACFSNWVYYNNKQHFLYILYVIFIYKARWGCNNNYSIEIKIEKLIVVIGRPLIARWRKTELNKSQTESSCKLYLYVRFQGAGGGWCK